MNTKIKFGVLIGIIVLLAALLIYGEYRYSNVKENAIDYETALTDKDVETKAKDRMLREKKDEIAELRLQNIRLRDSIETLQQEVGRLNSLLGKQGRELLANRKKMSSMQAREDSLVAQINRMMIEKSNNASKIDVLEEERLTNNKGMAELFERNQFLKDSIANATAEREAAKEKLSSKERIYEISNNTIVTFKTILPKKDNGKPARNVKRWTSTDIELELFHPEGDILLNEKFMVVLRDFDKNIPLPPRESNAGIDTEGEIFTFTQNPVPTISYPNYQDKESSTYMIQVFYYKNGEKYALGKNSGIQKIIFQ